MFIEEGCKSKLLHKIGDDLMTMTVKTHTKVIFEKDLVCK